MANPLISPGVKVTVTDESAYASPGTGTVPLIVLATRENKIDPTGTYADQIALMTKKEFANSVALVTSQRELTQFFGDVVFRKSESVIVEGDETHEYGLLAAYSYLGQGSRAFIVRADVDLGQLEPSVSEPIGPVPFGTFWLDTLNSTYGIHTYNGVRWNLATPQVVVKSTTIVSPLDVAVQNNGFLVFIDGTKISYYKGTSELIEGVEELSWTRLDTQFSFNTVTFAPHYQTPATPSTGDIWIKTTRPANGINLKLYRSDFDGNFDVVTIQGISNSLNSTTYIPQDGTSLDVVSLTNAQAQLFLYEIENLGVIEDAGIEVLYTSNNTAQEITTTYVVSSTEPVGFPADDALWYDPTLTNLDLLINTGNSWTRVNPETISYNVVKPTTRSDGNPLVDNDIWVDLSAPESEYPKLYRFISDNWELHNNTDQTTDFGVLFADLTDSTNLGTVALLDNAPTPLLYPDGMLAVNMCQSSNTVRRYNSDLAVWRNAAPNNANGSGAFGRLAQRKVISVAMQAAIAGNEELQEETKNFTLMCAPNFPEVYDELVELNIARNETAFIIVDAPMRKNPNEVIQWVLGTQATENGEEGLTSKYTYSAVYYPSVRTTTPSGDTVTAPASHSVLFQYAYNDNIAYPWFAPAGLTRGVVGNASNVGYIDREGEFKQLALTNKQRDSLYERKINPIANFPGEGVIVFGNKTLHSFDSALDRVNVARLVAYLRERFAVIGRPFLFEPNDEPTRDRAKAVYENFLFDIVSKRGVTDFAVVCDTSNNTPLRIDRNELWIDIAIVPTKSVEFIYIPIRLVNTGQI